MVLLPGSAGYRDADLAAANRVSALDGLARLKRGPCGGMDLSDLLHHYSTTNTRFSIGLRSNPRERDESRTQEKLTPLQRTTPSPHPVEQPTENTSESGAHPGVSDPDESGRSARSRSAYPPHNGSAGKSCRPWRIGRVSEHRHPGSPTPRRQRSQQQASAASKYISTTCNRLKRSRQIKNCHVGLCLMDHLQQLLKGLTDSWGVFWAVRGMKCQDRDAGC